MPCSGSQLKLLLVAEALALSYNMLTRYISMANVMHSCMAMLDACGIKMQSREFKAW